MAKFVLQRIYAETEEKKGLSTGAKAAVLGTLATAGAVALGSRGAGGFRNFANNFAKGGAGFKGAIGNIKQGGISTWQGVKGAFKPKSTVPTSTALVKVS